MTGERSKRIEIVDSMGAAQIDPTEWLEVKDPSKEGEVVRFHVPFMLSNWTCLFGRGCPGVSVNKNPADSEEPGTHVGADIGCCNDGVYLTDHIDRANVDKHAAMLTEEDLHKPALDYIRKNGHLVVYNEDEDHFNAKTKVRNGACVFVNRSHEAAPGDEGRVGCAFLHLAARLNKESVEDVDHTETMPDVCWQLPFRATVQHEAWRNVVITTIYPWDAAEWFKSKVSDMEYWCVNDSAAYVDKEPLYITAKSELIAMIGKPAYEAAVVELDKRREAGLTPPMPAAGPNGRSLIPLTVLGQ